MSKVETFYNDNLPYKTYIVNLQKNLKISVFNEVDDPKVILGDEEWLFYKGDNGVSSIQDYMGITRFNEIELEQHVNIFRNLNQVCNEKGITLVILIGPNKERVYGENMPNKYNIINEENASDQLETALVNVGIKTLYPIDEMKNTQDYITYYKYDTHWNDVGAFIASQAVLKELGMKSLNISDVEIASKNRVGGDLANMLAMASDFKNDFTYTVSYLSDVTYNEVSSKSTGQPIPYSTYECETIEEESVLYYFGDSYATAIKPYLCKNFSSSMFMHRNDMQNEFIMPQEGDVIILETVERYTKSLPVDAQNLINLLLSH